MKSVIAKHLNFKVRVLSYDTIELLSNDTYLIIHKGIYLKS